MSKQAAGKSPATIIQTIPLSLIDPSGLNPRQTFDEDEMNELTASVKESGVVQPIKVRPKGKRYEVVFGERRRRAALAAKLKQIPATVAVLNDEEALNEALIENAQRADVHPMEEAVSLQRLRELRRIETVAELARVVGKSERTIAARLSLLDLIEAARADYRANLITLGHATQIARLSPEVQQAALDACYQGVYDHAASQKAGHQVYKPNKELPAKSVHSLNEWIGQNLVRSLDNAPWPLTDATLVPEQGACTTCAFNTQSNPTLFGETQGALCTNSVGWKRKMDAWMSLKMAAEGDERPVPLARTYSLDEHTRKRYDLPDDTLGHDSFTVIEKKKDRCDFARPGLVHYGSDKGHLLTVCVEPKCPTHKGRADTADSSPSQTSLPNEAELEKKRARKLELFDARVAEPVRRRVLAALLQKIHPAMELHVEGRVTWPLPVSYHRRMAWEHFLRIPADTQAVIFEVLRWEEVLKETAGWGSKRPALAQARFEALSEIELVRFAFLCSVAHYGQNLGIITGSVDQSQIIALAEQHNVPYRLFDARERSLQSPGKKYHSTHRLHLLETLLGKQKVRPAIYVKEVDADASNKAHDVELSVKESTTPYPFLDGPEGVVLTGALVCITHGEHIGLVGTLNDAGNSTGGVLCKVALEGGKEVEILARDLVYDNPASLAFLFPKPEPEAITTTKGKTAKAAKQGKKSKRSK